MDLECNDNVHRDGLDLLRCEASEARGDLNTLFRAVRYASPHPDEPSQQRRRLHDSHPPTSEPDQEHSGQLDPPEPVLETYEAETEEDDVDRLWNMAIRSRSRDDSLPREADEGAEERGEPAEDDEARAERERVDREHSLMIHYMLIQANNLGVHLHTEGQIFANGRIPFDRVEQLYVKHAPFLPLPSCEDGQEEISFATINSSEHRTGLPAERP